MRACFIWKTDEEAGSKKIKFIRGATWWMEDDRRSFDIINCVVVDVSSTIYLVDEKPKDWTGPDFIEVVEVPYRINGKYEQIGCWMRYLGDEVNSIDEAICLAVKLGLPGFSVGKKE